MVDVIHACIDRVIPKRLEPIAAARVALEHSVGGQPGRIEAAMPCAKRWRTGRVLRVRFLDGAAEVRQRVKTYALEWCKWANLAFDFGDGPGAEIRISFELAGSWSAVGTDALVEGYFPEHAATMNFGWLRRDTPENELSRVVLHEFGHAIGLIHEHQNPDNGIPWNKEVIYRQLGGPPNGWDRAEVDHNMFERYGAETTNYTRFDRDSVMLYSFPKEWTRDGRAFPSNVVLSETDKDFIAQQYPRA